MMTCRNHPDRPRKTPSRPLCHACYEAARRRGLLPPLSRRASYVPELIDLLEVSTVTWDYLEERFERPRARLSKVLRNSPNRRGDLVKKVHVATYGVSDIPSILSVRNSKGATE